MAKQLYRAIADFSIQGFREVKDGELITISPDIIRDLDLADKVLQENLVDKNLQQSKNK